MQAYLWAVSFAAFCISVISLVVAWSAYELVNRPLAGAPRDKGGRYRKA